MTDKPAFRDHQPGELSSFAELMRELAEFRKLHPAPPPSDKKKEKS